MAEEKDLAVFKTICDALDENDWHYEKDEEKLTVSCGARGEDLPMDITINVDADRELILLFSFLPFSTPEDKRLEMAVAVSAVNNKLYDGSFDYNIRTGSLIFRLTNFYTDREISKDVIKYMIYGSCHMIDDFNDKFLMIAKNMISLDQFLESINK